MGKVKMGLSLGLRVVAAAKDNKSAVGSIAHKVVRCTAWSLLTQRKSDKSDGQCWLTMKP